MFAAGNFGDWHAAVGEVPWSRVPKTTTNSHGKLVCTCSGASPQPGLGRTCPPHFFQKLFLRLMEIQSTKDLNLYTRALLLLRVPPCWNKHVSTRLSRRTPPARHVVHVVSCPDVTWRAEWNLGLCANYTNVGILGAILTMSQIVVLRVTNDADPIYVDVAFELSTRFRFVLFRCITCTKYSMCMHGTTVTSFCLYTVVIAAMLEVLYVYMMQQ